MFYLNSCKVGSNTVEINQGFANIFVNKNEFKCSIDWCMWYDACTVKNLKRNC